MPAMLEQGEAPPRPDASLMSGFIHSMFRTALQGFVELNILTPRMRPQSLNGAEDLDAATHAPIRSFKLIVRQYDLDNLDALVEFADRENAKGRSVYVSAGLRRETIEREKSGKEADVIAVAAIKADLDDDGVFERALPLLDKAGLTPNFIAFTARHPHIRAHLWWLLEEPSNEIDRVKQVETEIAAWLGGDPKVVNPRHIMRLPGSVNWARKPGRIDELVSLESLRLQPFCLEEICSKVRRSAPVDQPRCVGAAAPNTRSNGRIPVWLERAENGDHWHNNMHSAVCSLVSRGVPADEIEALLCRAMRWPDFTEEETLDEIRKSITWAQSKENEKDGEPSAWDRPDTGLLGQAKRLAPQLPENTFGLWEDWIDAQARATGSPADYVAFGLLTSAAALIGYSVEVLPDPVSSPGWKVPVALWTALIGPPSSGKTPALMPFVQEVQAVEKNARKAFAPKIAEHEMLSEVAKQSEKAWKEEVKKAVADDYDAPPKPQDASTPPPIRAPSVYVMDCTIEELAHILEHSPRGILQFRDELAAFFMNMTRYSGDSSDRPHWLELYNGSTIKVDRVKHPEPIIVERALASILGGLQPARLSEILATPDDGLVERFLFIWPDISPRLERGTGGADMFVLSTAFENLYGLQMNPDGSGGQRPVLMPFDADAADAFFKFRVDVRSQAHNADGALAGWIGKAPGLVPRLAAILALLDWASNSKQILPETTKLEALQRALTLWNNYLLPMAKRAFGDAALPKEERLAARVLKEVRQRGAQIVNQRDVRRDWCIEGMGKDPAITKRVFEVLEEAGWMRPAFSRAGNSKGRMKQDWEVNPILFEH